MKNFLLDKHFVVKWTFFIVTLNSRWGLIFPKPSFYWQKWKLKKMKAQPALLFSNSSGYRQGYEFSLKGFPEVPILSKSWWRSSMLLLRGSKVNSQTKNAWSKLVLAYNMHISTSLPKKVSGVHRFEPTTAGTGEPVWGAKIR